MALNFCWLENEQASKHTQNKKMQPNSTKNKKRNKCWYKYGICIHMLQEKQSATFIGHNTNTLKNKSLKAFLRVSKYAKLCLRN